MTKGLIISAIMLSTIATMFTGCVAEEDVVMTAEDSARLSIKFEGVLNNFKRPETRKLMSLKRTRGKDVTTIKEVAQPQTTWWNTRSTIDSLSNWRNMANRKMSVMIGSVVYGNFFVDETGHITASMGPFVFDDGGSSTASIQAWYPTTGTKDLDTFSVQTNQSYFAKLEASDLIYGKKNGSSTNINFYHKMSQIELHIKICRYYEGDDGRDTIYSKIKSVKLGGVYTSGDISRTNFAAGLDGTTVDSASLDTISICHYPDSDYYVPNEVGDTDTVYCYKGIIFPQKKSFTIILDVAGKLYTGAVEDYEYKEGVLYNVIVNLTDQVDVRVGDYLYCNTDGEVLCRGASAAGDLYNDGFVPIAVVFSDCPTYEDQDRGWNRGYAMSMLCVNGAASYKWCVSNGTNIQDIQYGGNYKLAITKLNGYDETYRMVNDTNLVYPAANATVNWTPTYNPSKPETSGWFMPSAGQLYKEFVVLGKPTSLAVSGSDQLFFAGQYPTICNNLNALFTKVASYASYHAFGWEQYYWSSSEYNHSFAIYSMYLNNNNNWHFYYHTWNNNSKTVSMRVRPVIAF